MEIHIYEYRGTLLIPTVGKTDAGFYIELEPVAVLGHGSNLSAALIAAEKNGNPSVATPRRGEYTAPVVLRHAKARTWKEFERRARFWKVKPIGESVLLIPTVHVSPDQGWRDLEATEFAAMSDVAHAVIGQL